MAALIATITFTAFAADENPKREMRAAWVAALGIDWPTDGKTTAKQKSQCISYLDALADAGFNAVFFHVRPNADRRYQTNTWTNPVDGVTYTVYEPVSESVTANSARGGTLEYDPLQFWIEECHKRGMELHAWVNPYRWRNISQTNDPGLSTNEADIPFSDRKSTLDKAPWVNGWLIHHYEKGTNTNNWKYTFNPALEATNTRIRNVVSVLTGAYDIDGIVFDDYFYPNNIPENSTGDDWTQYQAYKNAGGTMTIADWRRRNVNDMVAMVNKQIHSIKPWVRFGISPAGAGHGGLKTSDGIRPMSDFCRASDWAYSSIYSDAMAWMREKSIDYISPQIYWRESSTTNPFTPMSQWWSHAAKIFDRHFFASHSVTFVGTGGATDALCSEAAAQTVANRKAGQQYGDGNFGSVFYSLKNTITGVHTKLKNAAFKYRATVPAMTWIPAEDPGKITGLSLANGSLTWDALPNMRYIVYAIPKTINTATAISENGGYRAEYIDGVTYTNSWTLSSTVKNNPNAYTIIVAPLDRMGNEWKASTLGEAVEPPYIPYRDQAVYHEMEIGDETINIENLWIRNAANDPLEIDPELHRSMSVRQTDALQQKDIVYVAGRAQAAKTADAYLLRYDATTGQELEKLNLTFDSNWDAGFYPNNGVLTDDNNNLLVHGLSLKGNNVSVAYVDVATGKCTTVMKQNPGFRVDHLDVVGNATATSDANFHVLMSGQSADATAAYVCRYTVKGTTVTNTETITLPHAIGTASMVHAINQNNFYVDGFGNIPDLYNFTTGKATRLSANNTHAFAQSASGICHFTHGQHQFLVVADYDTNEGGYHWHIIAADDAITSLTNLQNTWVIPANGIGSHRIVSADYTAPVDFLQRGATIENKSADISVSTHVDNTLKHSAAIDNPATTTIYTYSMGNGLAAYTLTSHKTSGIDDITANQTSNITYTDLQGRTTDTLPTEPGIYIRRNGTSICKIRIK